jgi:hypothetical protein
LGKGIVAAGAARIGFVFEGIDKSVIYLIYSSFFLIRVQFDTPIVSPKGLEPLGTGCAAPRGCAKAICDTSLCSCVPRPFGCTTKAKEFHVGRAALRSAAKCSVSLAAPATGSELVPSHLYVVGREAKERKPTAGGCVGDTKARGALVATQE